MIVHKRLAELGLHLPEPPEPRANTWPPLCMAALLMSAAKSPGKDSR